MFNIHPHNKIERKKNITNQIRQHSGNKGPVKSHFQLCSITPNDVISMLGRKHQTLKPVNTFIKEITIVLNTKRLDQEQNFFKF